MTANIRLQTQIQYTLEQAKPRFFWFTAIFSKLVSSMRNVVDMAASVVILDDDDDGTVADGYEALLASSRSDFIFSRFR